MSSGLKTAAVNVDTADDPVGWRIANGLAIAAPYLLGGALFVVLYLQPGALTPSQAPIAELSNPAGPAVAPAPANPGAPPATVSSGAANPGSSAAGSPPASAPAAGARSAPAPAAPAAASASEPPLPKQPVPVEPDIASTMKLSGDRLTYPSAARDAHIQGVVVVDAIIGPSGAVQSVQAVSGPALLEVAALEAVRSWRYRPYLIYGKPVAFRTQVTIDFKLDVAPQ